MTEKQKRPLVQIGLVFSIIITLLTFADYTLPRTISEETVVSKRGYTQYGHVTRGGSGRGSRKFLFLTDNAEYPCSYSIFMAIQEEKSVVIHKTLIFREVRLVEIEGNKFYNDYSFYNFGIFPVTLWISTLCAVFYFVFNGKFGHLETLTILSTMVSLFILIVTILNKIA